MYSRYSAVKSKFKVSSYTKNHNTQAKNLPASPKEIIRANDSKKQLQAPPPPRNRVSIRKLSPQIEKVSSGKIKASVPPSSLETPSEAQSEQSATKIKNTQVKNGKQPNINSKSNKNEAIVANHKYPNNLPKTTKATRTEIKNKTGSPRLGITDRLTKQNPISKNIQKDPQKPLNGIKPKNETTGNKSRPTSSHLYKTAIQKAQASPASSPRSGVSPENTNKKAIDRSSFSSSMARQSANKSLNKGLDKSVKASEKKNCNTLLTKDSPNSRGSARGSKNSNLNKNQVAFKKMKNSVNNNNDEDFTQKKKNQPDLIEIDADDTKTGTSNSILKNPISSEDLETLDGFISLTNQNSIQENTEHCKKPYQIQSFDAFYVPNAFDIKIIFNEEKQINENVTNDGLYEFELLNQKYNEIADILNSNEFRQFYDGEIPEILLEKF